MCKLFIAQSNTNEYRVVVGIAVDGFVQSSFITACVEVVGIEVVGTYLLDLCSHSGGGEYSIQIPCLAVVYVGVTR